MNDLLRVKLISLLSDASQVTNEEMQIAYEDFVEQASALSQSEADFLKVFRMLSITRVELTFLQSLHRYEQGKKCLEIYLS